HRRTKSTGIDAAWPVFTSPLPIRSGPKIDHQPLPLASTAMPYDVLEEIPRSLVFGILKAVNFRVTGSNCITPAPEGPADIQMVPFRSESSVTNVRVAGAGV